MKKTNIAKQIMALAAAVLFCASLQAQEVEFRTGTFGKMVYKSNEPRLIGSTDGSVVTIDELSRKLVLARYDIDQNEKARVELGSSKEMDCYGGFVNGNNVDLLMVRNNDGALRVWRDRRSYDNLQPVGEPAVLTDIKGEAKDKFYYSIATSSDQELLAAVSVAARKGLDPEMKVALYNRQLESYWHMPIESTPFNQMIVNDSGEVVLGYCTIDQKRPCTFAVVDGENVRRFAFRIDSEVWPLEATLVRYADNKLIMAVAVCEGHKVVMPIGSNVNRIDFYCYDVLRDELTINTHHISDLESARLANKKDDKPTRNNWVQFGNITQAIADGQGAYLMLDQTWRVTKNDFPVEQDHLGMLVIRINADGKVQWTRSLRLGAQSAWGSRLYIDYRWRHTADGIMLAAPQNAKNADLTDDKPIKVFRAFKDKAILSVITLDPAGKLTRNNYDIGKQSLIGSARIIDNHNYVLFLTGSNGKGQIGTINIR